MTDKKTVLESNLYFIIFSISVFIAFVIGMIVLLKVPRETDIIIFLFQSGAYPCISSVIIFLFSSIFKKIRKLESLNRIFNGFLGTVIGYVAACFFYGLFWKR